MADPDDPADAAARLERALERIAALSVRPAPAGGSGAPQVAATADTEAVKARLDQLIARLRATIDHSNEG